MRVSGKCLVSLVQLQQGGICQKAFVLGKESTAVQKLRNLDSFTKVSGRTAFPVSEFTGSTAPSSLFPSWSLLPLFAKA